LERRGVILVRTGRDLASGAGGEGRGPEKDVRESFPSYVPVHQPYISIISYLSI